MDSTDPSATDDTQVERNQNIPYRYAIDNGCNPKLPHAFREGDCDLIDDAIKPFSHYSRSHGALTERLLLYGNNGIGKRHLAIEAAHKITSRPDDGRRIFWVQAHNFESFVRDYLAIYPALTGSKFPRGLGVPFSLSKVKHTLESRRQEWLLVIFDLESFAEDTFNGSRQKLTTYLPERGQIFITSAHMARSTFKNGEGPRAVSALVLADTAVELAILNLNDAGQRAYVKEHCPLLTHSLDHTQLHKLLRYMFLYKLFLTTVSASLSLLGMDLVQYSNLFQQGLRMTKVENTRLETQRAWGIASNILWNALADHDTFTCHVLTALSVVDESPIPVRLLQKLKVFAQTRSERLEPALDTLRSIKLVEIVEGDEPGVRIHHVLRKHLAIRQSEKEARLQMITNWMEIFRQEIEVEGDPENYDPERVWKLFPHIWIVVDEVPHTTVPSKCLDDLVFLVRLTDCLIKDRKLSNYAGMLTDNAYQFWSRLNIMDAGDTLQKQYLYVRNKQCRIEALLSVGEKRMAETDLRRAQNAFMVKELYELYPALRRKTEELEVRVLLIQERYIEAEKLVEDILKNPEPGLTPRDIAQRHNWMAQALDHQGINVTGYQYSCVAMEYWRDLPDDVKWGKEDIFYLGWVDRHCGLLVRLGKYKGALTFLEELIESWLKWAPYGASFIYRFFNFAVFCYASLNHFNDAESAVIQMLELCPVSELSGESLWTTLSALCELAICYVRFGHLVEAEAIFKFNLAIARKKKAEGVEYEGGWPVDWWTQLMFVLMAQGKHDEVRTTRDEWQDAVHNEEFVDEYVANAKKRHARGVDVYMRALWAEEEGRLREFKYFIEGTEDGAALKRMTKMYGSVRWRIRERNDLESDLDVWEVETAMSSKILHLLGQDIVYTPLNVIMFEGKHGIHDFAIDDGLYLVTNQWSHPKQRLLQRYWKWCKCRRRTARSTSPDSYDWRNKQEIQKQVKEEAELEEKQLKQITLDDWIWTLIEKPVFMDGCKEDCPCREANLRGPIEYEKLVEDRLWVWQEPPKDPPEFPKPLVTYKKVERTKFPLLPDEAYIREEPAPPPTPTLSELGLDALGSVSSFPPSPSMSSTTPDLPTLSLAPLDDPAPEPERSLTRFELEVELGLAPDVISAELRYRPGSTWVRLQSELQPGEREKGEENYIIPRCLNIPVVTITGTDEEGEELYGARKNNNWTGWRQMGLEEVGFSKEGRGRWVEVLRGMDEVEFAMGALGQVGFSGIADEVERKGKEKGKEKEEV